MDRYVLVAVSNQKEEYDQSNAGLELAKRVYDVLKDIANSTSATGFSTFPACTVSGVPAEQRWYFAIQASYGSTQFCSSEWEELGMGSQQSDSEEVGPSAMETCLEVLDRQEEEDMMDSQPYAELYEEAAEGFHQLSDQLPPPGRALVDVILFALNKKAPTLKEFLPVLGSLKHMQTWHAAKISVVTEDNEGWQKMTLYMSANMYDPHAFLCCLDENELWRGSILIREKKFASELQFEGFCLKKRRVDVWSRLPSTDITPQSSTKQKPYAEVFQYFQPVLELLQLVTVSDLPIIFHSSVEFELGLTKYSTRSQRLLDQLRTLRGKVGALFSLSCIVSPLAVPPFPQLSSQKWKEFVAKRPKAMPGEDTIAWLCSLPCLYGDQLLKRERKLTKVQALVLKEFLRRREALQKSSSIPINDLKVLLSLTREQYLRRHESNLPRAKSVIMEEKKQHISVEQGVLVSIVYLVVHMNKVALSHVTGGGVV
ncbi:mdm2-binding protein-like [Arapaima gigas]